MGIKTESLANARNLSEGLTPDIYIKRTVTKQNNVFSIDPGCRVWHCRTQDFKTFSQRRT